MVWTGGFLWCCDSPRCCDACWFRPLKELVGFWPRSVDGLHYQTEPGLVHAVDHPVRLVDDLTGKPGEFHFTPAGIITSPAGTYQKPELLQIQAGVFVDVIDQPTRSGHDDVCRAAPHAASERPDIERFFQWPFSLQRRSGSTVKTASLTLHPRAGQLVQTSKAVWHQHRQSCKQEDSVSLKVPVLTWSLRATPALQRRTSVRPASALSEEFPQRTTRTLCKPKHKRLSSAESLQVCVEG